MKKTLLISLMLTLASMHIAMAGPSGMFINKEPSNFAGKVDCSDGNCLLILSWGSLTDASPSGNPSSAKYAIGVNVKTKSPGGLDCPDTEASADFTVPATSPTMLVVDLTNSGLVPNGHTLISVDATIKGMILPVSSGFSPNKGLATLSIQVNFCG